MICTRESSSDLSVHLVFRIAGLASIRRVPVELKIIFIPFWESRIILKIMLARVGRKLRD